MEHPPSIHWILEKDTFLEGNPERMAQLIQARGDKVHTISYIPFGAPLPIELDPETCVVVYGSINLVRALLKQFTWSPTAWFDLEALRCTTYLTHWQAHSVQRNHCFMTFGCLPALKWDLYAHYSASLEGSSCIFVRPDANTKPFSGQVIAHSKFEEWYNREKDCYTPDPTSLVLVSQPSLILREWRFVVSEGKVLTGSLYKEHCSGCAQTVSAQFGLAQALAQKIAQDPWQPLPIYVLDICQTPEGFFLLEIGSVNCAGLYTCDLAPVVETMAQLALRDWSDLYGQA